MSRLNLRIRRQLMLSLSRFRLVGGASRNACAKLADGRGQVAAELRAPNPVMQVSAIPPAFHRFVH
jgi:hypothetical protein